MSEILPCPFCGEVPEIDYWRSSKPGTKVLTTVATVRCFALKCRVRPASEPAARVSERAAIREAIKRWSARAPMNEVIR